MAHTAAGETASLAACQQLTQWDLFQQAEHIGCYRAAGSEFDLRFIMETCWEQGKRCYLPVLSSQLPNQLHFIAYEKNTALCKNKYGIQEPLYQIENEIEAQKLELVLVPLIGFDNQGQRLGSGSGYYDRTFAFLQKAQGDKQRPFLLGVGFAAQEVTTLPKDEWDVKLDGVLTEKHLMIL